MKAFDFFRRALLLAVLAVGLTRSAGAVPAWRAMFDPFQVPVVYLELNPADWDRVRFDQPSQSADWVPEVAEAWMHGEGEVPIRVSLRRKGESDPPLPDATDPRKVSLKIDVNAVVPGQRWHGLAKLSLENGGSDLLVEGFAWLLHRQATMWYGYDAALSGWVQVVINGEPAGVFVHAEQRDAQFLRNHDYYSPTSSWLYKVDGSTFLDAGVGDSPAFLHLDYAPFNSGPGKGGAGGGATPPELDGELQQWIHLPGFLTLAACNAFAENRDSLFTHSGKNSYAVDFDPPFPRTRLYFPWDLDTCVARGTESIYGTETYQLAVLGHPWFGQVYEHILRELLDGPFSEAALVDLLDRLEVALTPALSADPYVYPGGPSGAFQRLRDWVGIRGPAVREQWVHPFVPRPVLNHPGGEVATGFGVTLQASTGAVYYTLDGQDPRAPGGAPAPSARLYAGPIPITRTTAVTARTLDGSLWSGLPAEAVFYPAAFTTPLRLTEIMYHPAPGPDALVDPQLYEFLEFRNTGPEALDLSGYFLDGVDHRFVPGTVVPPGAFVVLVGMRPVLRSATRGWSPTGSTWVDSATGAKKSGCCGPTGRRPCRPSTGTIRPGS